MVILEINMSFKNSRQCVRVRGFCFSSHAVVFSAVFYKVSFLSQRGWQICQSVLPKASCLLVLSRGGQKQQSPKTSACPSWTSKPMWEPGFCVQWLTMWVTLLVPSAPSVDEHRLIIKLANMFFNLSQCVSLHNLLVLNVFSIFYFTVWFSVKKYRN